METTRWFDRKFDFKQDGSDYEPIYERLKATPAKLEQLLAGVPEEKLNRKTADKWSVKEQTGHLAVLEPLWQKRIQEIIAGAEVLAPADLDNKATTEADFNRSTMESIRDRFVRERKITLGLLEKSSPDDRLKSSLHPRLQQPMRLRDLAFFVAEHDDHHLDAIRQLIQTA